jgi:glucose-6-phosphate isomerase
VKSQLGRYEETVRRRIDMLTAGDAVGRVWRRDATLFGGDAARHQSVANRLGWLDIASRMRAEAPALDAFARDVRDAGFTSAVLLGMGGSSLAPEVLRRCIPPREGYPRLCVLDSTDPATILGVEREVDLAHTLFFVSSKSGGTIESASLFAYFHERVSVDNHDRAGDHFVAITDAGTALQGLAKQHGFRRVFTNPSDIGGRYSALSYFGLAPAAVAGVDVARLLGAATAAEEAAKRTESDALRLGATVGELALTGRNKCTFVVSASLESFGLWVEQLIAESTGKLGLGVVPVVGEPLGSPGSYGDDRLFVQLRLKGDASSEQDAFIGALWREGQPVITIDLDAPYDLGREFFRWEFATAVAGLVLGTNPFDEPNVQESKDNTARVLRELEAGGALHRDAVDAAASREAIEGLLSALRPGDYFAITAYIRETARGEALLRETRGIVRDVYGVATTLGYGPRFLHSTGQLHKGGPPQGVFLQVTADDSEDTEVPGRLFTFGQLKAAQAIGDYESLRVHERPVLWVSLGEDADAGMEKLRDAVRSALGATVAARR